MQKATRRKRYSHSKKLLSFIIAALAVCTFSFAARAQESAADKIIAKLDKRGDFFRLNLDKWKMTNKTEPNYTDPHYVPDKNWKKATAGLTFPQSENGIWLWSKYKVPETMGGVPMKGAKILFRPAVTQSEDVYINGVWKGNSYNLSGEFMLTDNATPGEEYVILIHGMNRFGQGAFLRATLVFIPQQELDLKINTYLNDLRTTRSLIEYAPDAAKWNEIIDRSAAAVDVEAFDKKDFDRFSASLDSARKLLEPVADFTRKFSLYMLGYSHIDLAYRWDKREGENIWVNTTRTVLRMMDETPDWTYCAGQAAGYQYIEKKYPDLWAGIKKRVSEGRWEIVGGMWAEPDSNLPGGESFVRQLLYGKRWFREKFGKDIVVGWTPDSFGYNWNLAQIYKKAGITGFLTQKINWNDTNKFPYHIFWWESPDGSRLLTYFAIGDYTQSLDTDSLLSQLKTMDKDTGVPEDFAIFGVGDHGGGVTQTSLDRAAALIADPLFPRSSFTTADAYFKHLLSLPDAKDYPVYDNELYLEYHRGTYTTQGTTKRNNRKGEAMLADAEMFSSIASRFGYKYPRAGIRSAWDILMFNQFHDILPGSSVKEAYVDADSDYAKLFDAASAATDGALKTIAGKVKTTGKGEALMVFNSLPWKRDAVVAVNIANAAGKAIVGPDGKVAASQQIKTAGGKNQLLFVASQLPASGYTVYRVTSSASAKAKDTLKATPTSLENEFVKITVNPATGNISSMVDKRTSFEYFGDGREGNMLQCYRDQHEKYDAWNIKLHEEIPVTLASAPEVVENGPVRVTLKLVKTIGKSTFTHYISLVRGVPQMFGRLEVDWQESHVMAKLAFQLNMLNDTAWYEIPYAAIGRAAVAKNSFDKAKWEVNAQKWVAYDSPDGKAGFSLLNNGKYGYDTKDNVLRMSLLRSPKEPDPVADMKHHTIEYAIYPHAGDWRASQTPRRGYEFNNPALTMFEKNHSGTLPASKSFFASEPSNVILSSVKAAEDSDALILRVYEATGKDSTARITLPAKPKAVFETNLMEEQPKKVSFKDNEIVVPIGHYELKTLKVVF